MTSSPTRDVGFDHTATIPGNVIRKRQGLAAPNLKELWHYRELVYFLAWRDVKVRYAQTVLGAAWTLFQPLALMLVFTYAFQRLGNIGTEGVPYPVFVLAGLSFWTFFSRAILQGSDSLVANAALLTRIYCPRILIPIATIVSALVDFALTLVLFVGFAAVYGYHPTWELVLVVPVFLLGFLFATGTALLLSAINVRFRDIRQGLPFLVQLWLFLSPVAYPIDNPLLYLNPLVGIIDAYRWCLIGTPASFAGLAVATAITVGTLAVAIPYFSRAERTFADVA